MQDSQDYSSHSKLNKEDEYQAIDRLITSYHLSISKFEIEHTVIPAHKPLFPKIELE